MEELSSQETIINRHRGKRSVIKLKAGDGKEDEIIIDTIEGKNISKLYKLMKVLKGMEMGEAAIFENIDDEFLNGLCELAIPCLKPHYANVSEEALTDFVKRNAIVIAMGMWESNLNLGTTNEVGEIKRLESVDRLRERVRKAKEEKTA